MRSWGWQVSLLVLARDCFILATLIEFFYLLLSSSKSSLLSKNRYVWKWIKEKVGACFKWGLLKETCPLDILTGLLLAGWEASLFSSAASAMERHTGTQEPQVLWSKSCAGCWPWELLYAARGAFGSWSLPRSPCTSSGLTQPFWGTRAAGAPPPLLHLLQISVCKGNPLPCTAEGGLWGSTKGRFVSQHTEI